MNKEKRGGIHGPLGKTVDEIQEAQTVKGGQVMSSAGKKGRPGVGGMFVLPKRENQGEKKKAFPF